MTKTIRIMDSDFDFIRANRSKEERDQDTVHRLLARAQDKSELIDYARIEKIVKNSVESAMAR
jgi:hypothetical protein